MLNWQQLKFMKWIRIFRSAQIPVVDFIKLVRANDKKICIIKAGGKFYATQSICPHAGADLSNGWCKDGKLICPYHRYSYDLETGRGCAGQGDYINTYLIELRADGLYVAIPERWKFFKRIFRL
jgi:nitrite reductase/ring-hydroxylating ferredoxin subunit